MRSLGGSDDESNLVSLTGREHYIAHLLLAKINCCSQTAYALWMMQCRSNEDKNVPFIRSSRMYEWARKEFAKYISRNNKIASKGERNSQHGTRWICNIDLKENRKISKTDELPQGWILGRNRWNQINDRKQLQKRIQITDGTHNKTLTWLDELPIPIGWHIGRTFSEKAKSNLSKSTALRNALLKNTSGQGGRAKTKRASHSGLLHFIANEDVAGSNPVARTNGPLLQRIV